MLWQLPPLLPTTGGAEGAATSGPITPPTPVPVPRADALTKPNAKRPKRNDKGAEWHRLAMPSAPLGKARDRLEVFAALNGKASIGYVARCDVTSGRMLRYRQATPNRVTALSVAPDGAFLAVGTNEGEVILFDGQYLSSLHRFQPHDIFLTSVTIRAAPAAGAAALSGALDYSVLTCAGDHNVQLTSLPGERLKRRMSFATIALLLSIAVALLAIAMPSLLPPSLAAWLGATPSPPLPLQATEEALASDDQVPPLA